MLITKLAIRKHSRTLGEIHWPEIGSIGVNGVDRVLGTILRSGSDRLRDRLAFDPSTAVDDMEAVEAMASHMFPNSTAEWLWLIHGNVEILWLEPSN
jgi:hypothetical protein